MAGEVKKCEFVDKKRREKQSCLTSTPVENMRDQPEALKLVNSPRRPGKAVENTDENSKRQKSMKLITANSSSSSSDGSQKRKSLQILQPSASGQRLLIGGKMARKTKNDKKHSKAPKGASRSKSKQLIHLPKCSKDNESTSSSSEVETTTRNENASSIQTSSEEAYSLMVQDKAPEKYWELVAEERRKALEETLEENLKLYQLIDELKAENKVLQEKASHSDYFATLYKVIAQDDHKPQTSKDI